MRSLGIIICELCKKELPFDEQKITLLRTNKNEPMNYEPIPNFYSEILANIVRQLFLRDPKSRMSVDDILVLLSLIRKTNINNSIKANSL